MPCDIAGVGIAVVGIAVCTLAADTVCLSLFDFFLAGSERIFYFCKSDVSAVQGHSR